MLTVILYALKKEFKIFFRYWSWIFDLVLQPFFWLLIIYYTGRIFENDLTGFEENAGSVKYMEFMLIGETISAIILAVFWSFAFSIRMASLRGVIEQEWSSWSNPFFYMFCQMIFSLFSSLLTSISVLLLSIFIFDLNFSIISSISLVIIIVLVLSGIYGLGLIIAALTLYYKRITDIFEIFSFFIITLAGSTFPISVLPDFIRWVSYLIPMTYGVDMIRHLTINTEPILSYNQTFIMLTIFALFNFFLGAITYKVIVKKVKETGNLGYY